jgi:hypothetical protein
MTSDEREELNRAIGIAKLIHERAKEPTENAVVLAGALIRAVELLAKDAEERRKLFGQDEQAAPLIDVILEEDTRLMERTVQLIRSRMVEATKGGILGTETATRIIDECRAAALSENKRTTSLRRQALDDINRLLDDAGVPHDGQLTVNRVRLLIEQRDDTRNAHQEASTNPTATFPDDLVERLGHVIESSTMATGVQADWLARAILAELAKVPVELPSAGHVVCAWGFQGRLCSPDEYAAGERVAAMFAANVAPILAAKDARIAELESVIDQKDACIIGRGAAVKVAEQWRTEDRGRIADLETSERALRSTIELLASEKDAAIARIAELEARSPANECTNAERQQYEATIGRQLSALLNRDGRIAELEKRLAEQVAPVNADGKTPGQVGFEAWQEQYAARRGSVSRPWSEETRPCHECEEASAQAVLRAFGNGAEALRQVRKRIGNMTEAPDEIRFACRRVIDDEIAKVGGQAKTTSVATACTVCGCPSERAFLDPCIANQKHSFEV